MKQPLIFKSPKLKRWQDPINAFSKGLGVRATFFGSLEHGYNTISAPRCFALMDREIKVGFDFVGVAMRIAGMTFKIRAHVAYGDRHGDIVFPSLFAVAVMKHYPFKLYGFDLVDQDLKRFVFYVLFDYFKANYSEAIAYVSSHVTGEQKRYAFEGLHLRFSDIVTLSGLLKVNDTLVIKGACVIGRRVIIKRGGGYKYFGLNFGLRQGKQLYPYNGGRLKYVIHNNPVDLDWYKPLCEDNKRLKDAARAAKGY